MMALPEPFVMDFGLARRFDDVERTLTAIAEGSFAGTPAYMPPEQLKGESLTPASDIHALGVVLFRMTTGRLPFPGRKRPADRHASPQRQRPVSGQVGAGLSRRWRTAVLACLAFAPGDRPQTAVDVGDLLHGRKALRRVRQMVSAAVAATLLGFAAVGVYAYLTRPAARRLRRPDTISSARSSWIDGRAKT
jgi:serine/threonine-protein kinase